MRLKFRELIITILKLFPGILSILIVVAGSIGLFEGENKFYTLPIFLFSICVHILLSIKYKLSDKWLLYIYLSIAAGLIIFRIFFV